ncbi:ABC transporter permease [Candidatus Daviesbacteria bacterium]|nr:ABC transporter permease [Candidatus Daviesbacteria bacterium]
MNFTKFVRRNIRRTPYQALAAVMVMFLTFFALSIFLMAGFGSQQILKYYESKPQAIAFFKDNTTQSDVEAIKNALTQTGKVTKLKYVSKDDALQIYRERNKNNPVLLELVTANILPSSLEISTITPEDLKPIADIIKKEPVVDEVVFPEDVVASLTQATRFIRVVGGTIVAFLGIFSVLIVTMVIGFKIRIRRDEIEIMKLLGASTWFIRLPFIMEGIFYAMSGAVLGWLLASLILWYFEPLIRNNLGEVSGAIFPISLLFIFSLLLAELLIALIIGALGSFSAVRRYLRL